MTDTLPTPAERAIADRHDQILYRWGFLLALVFVIAVSSVASAYVDLANRNDAQKVGKAIRDEADKMSAYADYDECMAAEETTSAECDAAFG